MEMQVNETGFCCSVHQMQARDDKRAKRKECLSLRLVIFFSESPKRKISVLASSANSGDKPELEQYDGNPTCCLCLDHRTEHGLNCQLGQPQTVMLHIATRPSYSLSLSPSPRHPSISIITMRYFVLLGK